MARTSFTIGEKSYPYELDLRAIRMAESSLETGLFNAMQNLNGITLFMTVLWAGIARLDSTVTFIDIEKAITKAINKKQVTFAKVQEFVLTEIRNSGVLTGFDDEEEDDSSPLPQGES